MTYLTVKTIFSAERKIETAKNSQKNKMNDQKND